MVKQKISLTIDKDTYETFREFCRNNGMKVSTKVELLMKSSIPNTTLKRFIE